MAGSRLVWQYRNARKAMIAQLFRVDWRKLTCIACAAMLPSIP
jgi:hypothetical protein